MKSARGAPIMTAVTKPRSTGSSATRWVLEPWIETGPGYHRGPLACTAGGNRTLFPRVTKPKSGSTRGRTGILTRARVGQRGIPGEFRAMHDMPRASRNRARAVCTLRRTRPDRSDLCLGASPRTVDRANSPSSSSSASMNDCTKRSRRMPKRTGAPSRNRRGSASSETSSPRRRSSR